MIAAALALAIALGAAANARPPKKRMEKVSPVAATSIGDDVAIRAVIEAFRVAIIAKDKAALNRLPVSPEISFLASVDADTLVRLRHRHADAKRLLPGTYPAFVDEITSNRVAQEETFEDITISTDGSIASVFFRYRFKENGTVTNWGHESWAMVATDTGWKIGSIIYSVTLPRPVAR